MGRTQPAATPERADLGWLTAYTPTPTVSHSPVSTTRRSAQIHVTAAVADEGQALVSGRLLADISSEFAAEAGRYHLR